MVLELCTSCGEEHEQPRGEKCKRTKLPRKGRRGEKAEESGSEAGSQPADIVSVVHVTRPTRSSRAVKQEPEVLRVEDEEERELRRELERRACERRKRELRAALAGSSDEEEVLARKPRARGKVEKKKKGKERLSSSESSSPEKGDSTSSGTTTSSSDSSDDSSTERKRKCKKRKEKRKKKKSKFSIEKFTVNEKSVKKLSIFELLHAALMWGVKRAVKVGMTVKDLEGYMGHIAYMTMHATTGNYTEEAYRGYDRAVREKVKEKGIKCFKMGDQEISLLHFNLDNSRSSRDIRKLHKPISGQLRYTDTGRVRGACYGFNYNKDGCVRKNCEWEHRCIKCRSGDHGASTCQNRRV